jgi:PAS domain S-box-containing protein
MEFTEPQQKFSSSPVMRPRRILVVEDSTLQAKRLKRLLVENGYDTEVAVNGQQGLELAVQLRPSLILSDIIMPVMDGYQMCRTIKSDPRIQHIPVVLLTSLSDPRDVFRGLESGADSYISKPYDKATLLGRIGSVLNALRSPDREGPQEELVVFVGGKRYAITSTRRQILNLLLSTYQDSVEQNRILREMRTKLVLLNEELEKMVAERTVALEEEIVERKRAQEALGAEKERLSVTLRSIGDAVITTSTDGKVVLMNRAAEDLTGWSQNQALGQALTNLLKLSKSDSRESGEATVARLLKGGGLLGPDDQFVLRSRDATDRIVSVRGAPILDQSNNMVGVVLVLRDITASKRMEEELAKAQKLESVGVLAGGIAHDFNNLLTAILGNVGLAKIQANPAGKAFKRLEEAERASLRAKDLTQQLLTFAKGGAPVRMTASIGDILKESALFAVRGSTTRCDINVASDLWPVDIDQGQISQVIHNLVINASQAMPEGGVIRVQAENLVIGSDDELAATLNRSKYVRLTVSDDGQGIAKHHLQKIFDPFFTTKSKGTGLGLATCYSILRNHEGMITVESEQGAGATFHVYLPASSGKEAEKPVVSRDPVSGNGRVLVMDDEAILRDFIEELLKMLGYDVQGTADGVEALQAYQRAREAGTPFDCVLMDLTIPGGMGGKETIKHLLEMDPEVKAIVSSGYCDDPVMANYRKHGFKGVVAKPYDAEGLSAVLHQVIAERG